LRFLRLQKREVTVTGAGMAAVGTVATAAGTVMADGTEAGMAMAVIGAV